MIYHAEPAMIPMGTLFSTPSESIAYLKGISASKVSLRLLSGDYFKLLISKHSPDFLFFWQVFWSKALMYIVF